MKTDDVPAGAVIALATGELMVTARRLTARLPRLNASAPSQVAAAVAVVRAGVAGIWPKIPPEAARDVMVTAAGMACAAGVTTVPGPITEMLPGELHAAGGMLALTAEWRAETYPSDRHAGVPMRPGIAMPPPLALASSVAFDRAEDRETCSSVSVLLTLAHLAIPGRVSLSDAEADRLAGHQGADGYYREDDEPEPEEYDPGPECDDAGGMSEYRHAWPEEGR
jgi:hypothetical protein